MPLPKIKFSLENLQSAARSRPRTLPFNRPGEGGGLPATDVNIPAFDDFGFPNQPVSGFGATNPDAPAVGPPSPPISSGSSAVDPQSAWAHYLGVIGASPTSNPEANRDWVQDNDKYYRTHQRGFDLYGLHPQVGYWQNLAGSGYENFDNNTLIRPEDQWQYWSTPGDWSGGGGYYGDWLKSDLDELQKAWPSLSDAEQQLWLDRQLHGTGLPSYLQEFQRTRPQWITDYITQNFVV